MNSDSNGTYKGPVLNHACNSLTYLSANQIISSQTFKTYLKGQEYFESEGGIKNSSFINCNDYYPELLKVFKKTKGDVKTGQYTYTSISGMVDGEITAFIKNEAAINDKNNFLHTPSAGVLFCSSLEANKVLTSDMRFRFNPTAKIVRMNLQSSRGSEATTAKAKMKYIGPLKFKSRQSIISPKEGQ